MKIWIDLTNSPHINFFKPFIKKWELDGYTVIITARDLANTIDLIKQNGWKYYLIGGHAGKNKIKKIIYFPIRLIQLFLFLRKNKPDIGISHSSFYSPLVCKILKIPCIYLNDNEYAKGNYLSFNYATLNLLPESLSKKALENKWINKYNIEFYPGIKEGIYLSQRDNSFVKSTSNIKKDKIYVRLEPWTAEYYEGGNDFLDNLIKKLCLKYSIIILPRSNDQLIYYNNKNFNNLVVENKPVPLNIVKNQCLLFIGAGGSMTRELAFMGVSTISVYQGKLLAVDKHLIDLGLMIHRANPKFDEIEEILDKKNSNENKILLDKGKQAFDLINKRLIQLANKH